MAVLQPPVSRRRRDPRGRLAGTVVRFVCSRQRDRPARPSRAGTHAPGPEASILKVKGSEIQQTIAELAAHALGPYGVAHLLHNEAHEAISSAFPNEFEHLAGFNFNVRKTTIYGGSSEVQKGIICRMILGL